MGNMGPVWDQEQKSVKDILLDKNTIARKQKNIWRSKNTLQGK